MIKQTSFCSVNTFLLLKQLLQNFFLFSFFVLRNINLSKSLMHTWCDSYRVFKFLIWNEDWKNQLILITKHINANVVFCFNFAKILFSHRKFNSIIIKITHKLFIRFLILSGCIFRRLRCVNMKPKITLLIVIFDLDKSFFWTF